MVEAAMSAGGMFKSFIGGEITEDEFYEQSKPLYKIMIETVIKQKARLGGTFATALAVPLQKTREYMYQVAGPDLIFISLNLSKECQAARLKQRHGEGSRLATTLISMYSRFHPGGKNEKNCYNITIEENMTKNDVMGKVLDIVGKL